MSACLLRCLLIASLLPLAGCLSAPDPVASDPAAAAATASTDMMQPARAVGYLATAGLPDSLLLVPPPPAPGTQAQANDEAVAVAALALHGSPRWQQAIRDADLDFPRGASVFSCALGLPVDPAQSPALSRLLLRSLADASAATRAAKQHYQRPRPFLQNGQAVCTPEETERLRHGPSYPSGHASIGWTWALVLAQLAPERTSDLMARARSFGESRLVCNVHWQSDLWQGRSVGIATFAALQENAEFQRDLAAARDDLAALQAQHARPNRDCTAEAAALAIPVPGTH